MKTIIHLIIAAMLVVGLSGCATTAATEPVKVKCPACHYEFTPLVHLHFFGKRLPAAPFP